MLIKIHSSKKKKKITCVIKSEGTQNKSLETYTEVTGYN